MSANGLTVAYLHMSPRRQKWPSELPKEAGRSQSSTKIDEQTSTAPSCLDSLLAKDHGQLMVGVVINLVRPPRVRGCCMHQPLLDAWTILLAKWFPRNHSSDFSWLTAASIFTGQRSLDLARTHPLLLCKWTSF